jgi:tRNA(Ile)-lysidine synthase
MGLGGAKKVQDIFVDAKVPAEERDSVPIICDDDGILWVVGHCLDERALVRADAKEVLHITVQAKI